MLGRSQEQSNTHFVSAYWNSVKSRHHLKGKVHCSEGFVFQNQLLNESQPIRHFSTKYMTEVNDLICCFTAVLEQ